jgi:cytochrome b561
MHRSNLGYSRTQIRLHWTIAILVLAVFVTHEAFLAAQDALRHGHTLSASQTALNELHLWGGALVLPLSVWRLVVRLRAGAPEQPAREPRIFRTCAAVAHLLLYGLIFLLPVSGILSYYGLLPTVSSIVHNAGEPALFILVVLHVAASLMHHFVWKTDVLRRMLRASTPPSITPFEENSL